MTPDFYSDQEVRALPLTTARQELLEEIMSTPVLQRETSEQAPARRRWWPATAAAAAVVAVAVGAAVPALRDSSDSPYAAGAVDKAERSTRVLVGAAGWSVTHVDGFGESDGEITFSKGGRDLEVSWRPRDSYQSYVDDRADVGRPETVELLGEPSDLFTYGPGDYTTIRPPEGDSFLEVRGGVGTKSDYLAVLGSLELVDEETWLAALPGEVVLPAERVQAIDEMLRGVPTPPGFDIGSIPDEGAESRYHFGADVTGTVTCAWIERWQAARERGDEVTAAEAADALATARTWPVLREMNSEGDYPEVVWEIAADVVAGRFPEYYAEGLGCD